MRTAKIFLLLGMGLIVSACTGAEVPTRNTPFEQLPNGTATTPEGYRAAQPISDAINTDVFPSIVAGKSVVSVRSILVRVPNSLKVSEANRYLPAGDIVWREDPIGDRHKQVQKIFQDAMATGVAPLDGPITVDVEILVRRFHALTEKARYTTGGVHSITFDMAIKNPKTGEILVPVRTVRADLDGFGGQQALRAEARGLTQKVRISDHLSEVIRQELSNPDGYKNASLGFFQLLNNM